MGWLNFNKVNVKFWQTLFYTHMHDVLLNLKDCDQHG